MSIFEHLTEKEKVMIDSYRDFYALAGNDDYEIEIYNSRNFGVGCIDGLLVGSTKAATEEAARCGLRD